MKKVLFVLSIILVCAFQFNVLPAQVTDGLVVYYPFNGNTDDESGNGNHGVNHGAILTTDRFGNNNSSYYFDGVNDFIDVPYPTLNAQSFSFCAWFRTSEFNSTYNSQRLFGGRTGTTQSIIYMAVEWFGGDSLFAEILGLGGGERPFASKNIPIHDNNWHFWSVTSDENYFRLYLDGILVGEDEQTTSGNLTPNAVLGAHSDRDISYNSYFKGDIDDVRIYNRALTESEIQELFNEENSNTPLELPYFADFNNNDLSDWSLYKSSSGLHGPAEYPYIENDRLFIKNRDQQGVGAIGGEEFWNNYTIEFDVRIEQVYDDAARGIGLFFYVSNFVDFNTLKFDGYLFDIFGRDHKLRLSECYKEGGSKELYSQYGINIYTGHNYHVKMTIHDNNIKYYLKHENDPEVLLCDYTVSEDFVSGGQFGFRGSDDLISIDNVHVYNSELPNQPPVANAGPDHILEATSPNGAEVTLDGSGSTDPDDDPLTFNWYSGETLIAETVQPKVQLPLGEHNVKLVVSDGDLESEDFVLIKVQDTTPPEITVTASPDLLWPPNHKMVDVSYSVSVTDVADDQPDIVLTELVSNEPDDAKGNGDGNTVNDIQEANIGTDDRAVLLRAERSAQGDGRIYTATYTAIDASGNEKTCSVEVKVPKSMGKGIADLANLNEIPDEFKLYGNYPNPFNPSTVIQYGLPEPAHVKVVVINSLGQVVQTLVNSQKSVGIHQVIWHGRDDFGNIAPNGIYYYQLKAGDYVVTQKMLLMR